MACSRAHVLQPGNDPYVVPLAHLPFVSLSLFFLISVCVPVCKALPERSACLQNQVKVLHYTKRQHHL